MSRKGATLHKTPNKKYKGVFFDDEYKPRPFEPKVEPAAKEESQLKSLLLWSFYSFTATSCILLVAEIHNIILLIVVGSFFSYVGWKYDNGKPDGFRRELGQLPDEFVKWCPEWLSVILSIIGCFILIFVLIFILRIMLSIAPHHIRF